MLWIGNMERSNAQICQAQDEPRERQRDAVKRSVSSWSGWVKPEGEVTDGEQAVSTHSGDRRLSRGCQCHVGS